MQGKGLEQKQQGKELVIDLQLSRRVFILLALGLALVALLGYLTWGQRQAASWQLAAPQYTVVARWGSTARGPPRT